MVSPYLLQEARVMRLAGHLGRALKPADPYSRRCAYALAGEVIVASHDDRAAVARLRARQQAFAARSEGAAA